MVVTPDGEAMLGFAKSILETNERAMRHFSRDDVRGHVRLGVLAPPALTRSIALAALEKGGCPWRINCSSDSQSGVHAAVFAGLGIAPHVRSLLPADLIVFQSKGLPRLGATEFVMLTRKGVRSSSLEALSSTLMNSPLSRQS